MAPSSENCDQLKAQLQQLEALLAQDQQELSRYENTSPPDTEQIAQWTQTVALRTEEVVAARTAWLTSGCLEPAPEPPPCYVVNNAFMSPWGYPDANGVNLSDAVVGDTTGDGEEYDAWVERPLGVLTPADAPAASSSVLSKINDSGVAVGTWTDSSGATHAYLWTANDSFQDLSVMLDGTQSWGADINNDGVVVGTVELSPPSAYPRVYRSFIYSPNGSPQIRYLGGLQGYPSSSAAAVNNNGQVVGTCYDEQGINYKPFLYANGQVQDFSGLENVCAFDINDSQTIIGCQGSVSSGETSSGMFIWSEGVSTPIPINGFAYAINIQGLVTGSAMYPNGQNYGFLYRAGVVFDLNNITSGAPVHIYGADDINDYGHIIAWGLTSDYSAGYDLLLVPCSPRVGAQEPIVAQFLPYTGAASLAGLKASSHIGPFPVLRNPARFSSRAKADSESPPREARAKKARASDGRGVGRAAKNRRV
jgi:probable HAF family extracellular repeat protein